MCGITRAMAALPELAPPNVDHLLSSTSVVQHIFYKGQMGKYYYPMAKDTKPFSSIIWFMMRLEQSRSGY
jgi:hypothetical protein